MAQRKILLLSDGRPGHYHLAEGVVAALERLAPVDLTKVDVHRRRLMPGKVMRSLLARGATPERLLALGYGIAADRLPEADLIISGGGDTLIANIAAARQLAASNIYCGSVKKVPPEHFTLIVSSYARHADLPRHLVTLKPNRMDPDALGRPNVVPTFGPTNPPRLAALLVGGNSGLFRYSQSEWRALVEFVSQVNAVWGTRWLISTSRRTPIEVVGLFAELARDKAIVKQFIDYRLTGPGTLPQIFRLCDVIVCTEDSSTMISEAICARIPTVGVSPVDHDFKSEEAEYRQYMLDNDWCRFLPMSGLEAGLFGEALQAIKPLRENHLDKLAQSLSERLPDLV